MFDGRKTGAFFRRVPAVGHGPVLHDPSIAKSNEPRGEGRDVSFVRYQQERDALLLIQALKDLHNLETGVRVEVPGGLVGEQERGPIDECPRDGHTLLLSPRELVRVMALAAFEAYELQELASPLVTIAGGGPVLEKRKLDVLERAGARKEVEVLKDEPELAVSYACQLVARERRGVSSAEKVAPLRRPVETAHHVHEGRLARARGTHDGYELAGLHRDVDATERVHLYVPKRVDLVQVLGSNEGHAHRAT